MEQGRASVAREWLSTTSALLSSGRSGSGVVTGRHLPPRLETKGPIECIEARRPKGAADETLKETDPYKTLFVSRISYETTEAKLKKEFEQYGPVRARHPRPSVPRPTEASSAPPRSHHGLAPSHRAVADQADPPGVQHGHRQAARLRLPRV